MNKSFILRNKSDIDKVFANGKTISNGLILIKYLDSDSTKFLFAVSSKKFKRAHDRNRLKRLMKESVRLSGFNLNKSLAIVYIGSNIASFTDVNSSILSLLDRIDK